MTSCLPESILKSNEKNFTIVAQSVKIIDNDGDPNWCLCKGKNICSAKLKKQILFEYKKRKNIELEYLLKKKNTKNIKKTMRYFTFKKFKKQTKLDLIKEIIVYFNKLNWKKQKKIIKDIKNDNYNNIKTKKRRPKKPNKKRSRKRHRK